MFEDGVAVDRIIGFDGVSEEDNFPTVCLTRRLVKGKVLKPRNRTEKGPRVRRGRDSDSGSDYDD
jgi:hypothetical protein